MSFGAVRLAIHPCGKPQGILAKANKKPRPKAGFSRLAGPVLHYMKPMETSPSRKDGHEGHGIPIRNLAVQVAYFLVDQDDDIRLSEARWNQLS